jgi:hypothetical protein
MEVVIGKLQTPFTATLLQSRALFSALQHKARLCGCVIPQVHSSNALLPAERSPDGQEKLLIGPLHGCLAIVQVTPILVRMCHSRRDFHEVTSNFSHPKCKFSEANDSVREVYATHLCQLREKIANGRRRRALRHLLRKHEAMFWSQRF